MNLPEAFIILFVAFLGVVAGTLTMGQDFFPYSRIIIILATGIACICVGVIFQHFSTPKKYLTFLDFRTSKPTKLDRAKIFVGVFLLSFDIIFCFGMPILTWQFAWTENHAYMAITYWDALMIGCFALGILLVCKIVKAYRLTNKSN